MLHFMAPLEPIDLHEHVSYLSLRNCCATTIKILNVHPTVGLFAQLHRGDTSFEFRMPPKDFESFSMAEVSFPYSQGNEPLNVGILHLQLSVESAESLHSQFTGALNIKNLPESSNQLINNTGKCRPHHAVVIGLITTVKGRQTFQRVMQLFKLASQTSGIHPGFAPSLIDPSAMKSHLLNCNELGTLESALRLKKLYEETEQDTKPVVPGVATPKIAQRPVTTQSTSMKTNGTTQLQKNLQDKSYLTVTTQKDSQESPATTNDDYLGAPLLCKPVPIYQRDLECLKPGNYINDSIVDFYLKYLVEKYEAAHGPKTAYAFSSLFYSQLTKPLSHKASGNAQIQSMTPQDRRYENVRNWVRKLHSLFSTDFIFIPVNVNQHWLLVIVQHISRVVCKSTEKEGCSEPNDPEESQDVVPGIVVLDSMANANPFPNAHYHISRYVKQFLECDAKKRNLKLDLAGLCDFRPRVPQQNNATDCALYMCQFAECFLEQPPVFNHNEARGTSPTLGAASSVSEPELSPKEGTSLKRKSGSVVLLVREAGDTSRRIVASLQPPATIVSFGTPPQSPQSPQSRPLAAPLPNLMNWFPTERVANKRQEILKLLHSQIEEQSSKVPSCSQSEEIFSSPCGNHVN